MMIFIKEIVKLTEKNLNLPIHGLVYLNLVFDEISGVEMINSKEIKSKSLHFIE